MNKNEIIEKILATLSSQKFEDWFIGQFDDYTAESQPTEAEIKQDIEKLFDLKGE